MTPVTIPSLPHLHRLRAKVKASFRVRRASGLVTDPESELFEQDGSRRAHG